jgi:hypothetical protein
MTPPRLFICTIASGSFSSHSSFAEYGADIEHAQSAHFQEVLQQFRTAAFQRFGAIW